MKASPDQDVAPAGPTGRGNLRARVSRAILEDVFKGRLRSGRRLVVQELAGRYRVSPTPVRESLVELAGLGIVDLLPNRGAVVRPFGPREVREISQVRRVLEVEATRSACGRVEPAELEGLHETLARLAGAEQDSTWDFAIRSADTRLHGLIAGSCGSARLEAEIHRYLTLFRTLRDVSHDRDARTHYARSNDVPEHLRIVEALRACDAEMAAMAMDRHIRSAARSLEEVVFGGPSGGAGVPPVAGSREEVEPPGRAPRSSR